MRFKSETVACGLIFMAARRLEVHFCLFMFEHFNNLRWWQGDMIVLEVRGTLHINHMLWATCPTGFCSVHCECFPLLGFIAEMCSIPTGGAHRDLMWLCRWPC